MRPIGYYVHHHGDGHRQRALALAQAAQGRIILLGTGLAGKTGGAACIDLPDDRIDENFSGGDGAPDRAEALHHAPLHHEGMRARAARVAGWIAAARPALMVVDVSVEIAMLARLCATPLAYLRLAGTRDDAPHRNAFQAARALIAPFARPLDDPAAPDWVQRKTHYCPGIITNRPPPTTSRHRQVLAVFGKGGAGGDGNAIAAAARATPGYQWRVIGPVSAAVDPPANLILRGWVDDAMAEISRAEIIIGGAGDGLVNAVIAARRAFICIPEPRPFDEQTIKAGRLAAIGAAIVAPRWPAARAWPDLLHSTAQLDAGILNKLDDPAGTARTWALLQSLAR
jgi:hypothetical protein